MIKKSRIFIILNFFLIFIFISQVSYSKYVIENTIIAARLDIDCVPPNIELLSISTSNTLHPNYANKSHIITCRLKLIEKNIISNSLNPSNIQFLINNHQIIPDFINFSLISQNNSEKTYEFSIKNLEGDGSLTIIIPEGIIEDKSGLINSKKTFYTNIILDNTAPVPVFNESISSDNKSVATISCNEPINQLPGWTFINNQTFNKEFLNKIQYYLPVTDYAQNTSNVFIDIQEATNAIIEYGTYDNYSGQSFASAGEICSQNTINSNSICKVETIFVRISGGIDFSKLRTRCYFYTYWDEGSYGVCHYSEIRYYYGYNPKSNSEWFDYNKNAIMHSGKRFIQLGGRGVNSKNNRNSNTTKGPLPEAIANQYLYGISGIQFKLQDIPDYSIVYQCYIKDVGWISPASDGEELSYNHTKPFTAFRINIVPKSEKQYLIDYWNNN